MDAKPEPDTGLPSHAQVISNESFPYMSMQEIDAHYARALALSIIEEDGPIN